MGLCSGQGLVFRCVFRLDAVVVWRDTVVMKAAEHWHLRDDGKVQCDLCPHGCLMDVGGCGRCRVRAVHQGELKAVGYGLVSSAGVDPIEKKPLNCFRPGSRIFSIGGWGCNLSCTFCQNWSISQRMAENGSMHTPEDVVALGGRSGSIGIAYTYNEPLIGFEFVRDCAVLARERGLVNVLVTNGFVCAGPAGELLPLVDALNIDIKSMDDKFYRQHCGAQLQPVLDFARQAVAAGCHVEITNLVIPGLNDSDSLFTALAVWIAEELGRTVPLHLSAYRPQYRMHLDSTPVATLERARRLCGEHLETVFLGNVPL